MKRCRKPCVLHLVLLTLLGLPLSCVGSSLVVVREESDLSLHATHGHDDYKVR